MVKAPKLFNVGGVYRAKKSFMSGRSTFVRDELLRFQSDGYSHYDDCFGYTFRSDTDGQTKHWLLDIDQKPDVWCEFFEAAHSLN